MEPWLEEIRGWRGHYRRVTSGIKCRQRWHCSVVLRIHRDVCSLWRIYWQYRTVRQSQRSIKRLSRKRTGCKTVATALQSIRDRGAGPRVYAGDGVVGVLRERLNMSRLRWDPGRRFGSGRGASRCQMISMVSTPRGGAQSGRTVGRGLWTSGQGSTRPERCKLKRVCSYTRYMRASEG